MVSKIWQFLTTDVKELNWKQATEVTKSGVDAGKAVLDLGKAVQEKKADLVALKDSVGPYVGEITSLLDVLNSPIALVLKEAIPFAPIAVTMLQLIVEGTKQEPTLAQCVALMSQAAYLESLRSVLGTTEGLKLVARLNERSVSDSVKKAIKKVGDLSLDRSDAEKVIFNFSETLLAKIFNGALVARLVDAGISEGEAEIWAQRVAWTTPRFFNEAVAEAKDKVKTLAELFNNGGRERWERHSSLDRYLDEKIKPLPLEKIFDEIELCFADIYVPLKVQPLMQDGKTDRGREPVQLEEEILRVLNDSESKIVFLQGEAGQGKSVFCRMFSDRVRQELYPSFTPILIRLRDLRKLANNLTETLEAELQYCEFVTTDSGWLTDRNQRFLFLLDGFDELLLQGGVKSGETGGLKEFLEQVERFQQNSHHRFVITGRPLSLQGIDRLISQSKNLARLSLCPIQDDDRNQWLDKWSVKFGIAERQKFEAFLNACPDDVNNKLAREPLLLYLLGRMHREKAITASDLQGSSGKRTKVKIYDAAIDWVLRLQRGNQSLRITGLESEDLRRLLMEVALCVVQTGNEMARVLMLEKRLAKDNSNRAIILMIAKSRASADLSEQKVLNNLLTTFYIKPADVDQEGSIEFAHKSFGEFLFAERLKEAIEDWSKLGERRRGSYLVSDEELHWEIYDLLGYGGLTPEVMDYLMVMLQNGQEWDPIILFERLNQFWESWYSGEFIDAPLGNLPQKKARLLREQMPDRENKLGLRQVDVYGGLNILILLLWLHRYAQNHSELKREIDFHLNGKSACGSNPHPERLLKVIHYANCLETSNFSSIVGFYLSRANLSRTDLRGANLSCADLSYASLSEVDLRGANLRGANFSRANLSDANLSRVYLRGADLRGANLSRIYFRGANLREADLCNTTLPGADLRGVNLRDAKVCNADLSGASLRGAYLRSADLSGADLSGANLRGVYLSGANLRGVYLIGADLSRADLNNLIYDQSTRWEQVKGLETATNIPDRLKQQLNLP